MRRTLVVTIGLAAALALAAPGVISAKQHGKEMGTMQGKSEVQKDDCSKMHGKGMMAGSGHGKGMMTGSGHGECAKMMGAGSGMGMGSCMEMMGMGSSGEKISDADRGDLLVLKGKMVKKQAEMLKKRGEAMITEGERLRKGGK